MTFPKSTKWTFLLVSTHIKRYPTIKGGYGLWKSPNASWLLCKMKKKGAEICIPSDTDYSLKVYRFASVPYIPIVFNVSH